MTEMNMEIFNIHMDKKDNNTGVELVRRNMWTVKYIWVRVGWWPEKKKTPSRTIYATFIHEVIKPKYNFRAVKWNVDNHAGHRPLETHYKHIPLPSLPAFVLAELLHL